MKLLVSLFCALGVVACGDSALLSREDGSEWDRHLAFGETRVIGAVIIDRSVDTSDYEVHPALDCTSANPSIVSVAPDRFGFALTGVSPGHTHLHVFDDFGGEAEIDVHVDPP